MKLVIIPTYNEKDNVVELLDQIYCAVPDIHVLIVDDNSPDSTGCLVQSLMVERHQGRLFLIERSGKLGLGTAYITGFKWNSDWSLPRQNVRQYRRAGSLDTAMDMAAANLEFR